jgi:hypothetical protein
MANSTKNPLDLLNLAGLKQLEKKVAPTGRPGVAPPQPTLGDIASLPGTWVGTGFNLIEVPNMNQAQPGPPPADKFRVILNNTAETLVFSEIAGDIINRGNAQSDIAFLGLHYLQQVSDVNLPVGQNGIHLETGLFLNVVPSTDPQEGPTIARLGTIPHGDSILAQGKSFTIKGGPQIDPVDPTPFTVTNGTRVNDTSPTYLALLTGATAPPGIPQAAVMNPNLVLTNAIQGQNIIQTTVILLDANPIVGVSNPGVTAPVGGITNIPFVNVNANAITFSAIFWIETVQNDDGSTFLQLQYTQTVVLDFPVFGPPPTNPVTDIKWPHISVATLRLQP